MIKNFLCKLLLAAAAMGVMLATSGIAVAATATTTFAVTATVVANCIINSASAMAFGTYTPGAGNVDQTSTIVVRCSNGTPYGLGLNAGTGTGSTLAQRKLSSVSTATAVNYNLFTAVARTQIWNNPATAGPAVDNQSGTGTGIANIAANQKTHTVFGRIADDATSQAATPAANYTSTVTMTINY